MQALTDIRNPIYERLLNQVRKWMEKTSDFYANSSNLVAVMMQHFAMMQTHCPVNWVGFYFLRPWKPSFALNTFQSSVKFASYEEWLSSRILAVGPFQGKAAVPLIPVGRGVCGQCIKLGRPIVVPDVHNHPDHIVCDEASQSELVLPIYITLPERRDKQYLIGVLDIDAQVKNFFSEKDVECLQECLSVWANSIVPSQWLSMFGPLMSELEFDLNADEVKNDSKTNDSSSVNTPCIVLDASQRRLLFNDSLGPLCGSSRSNVETNTHVDK